RCSSDCRQAWPRRFVETSTPPRWQASRSDRQAGGGLMIRTWLATVVLACLATSNLRADTSETVTVPFKLLLTKHIVIPIKVNGKGPFRVVFDTGAPINMLSTKIGREAGLIDKDGQLPLLGILAAGPSTIKSLEVGDLKTENVPAIVMDHPTVQ